MNKEELFQAYKKQYEDFKKNTSTEDMDSDEWNEYVNECDRLYWQAAEVILRGISLDELNQLVKYKESDGEIEQMIKELLDTAIKEITTSNNVPSDVWDLTGVKPRKWDEN